MQGEDCRRSFTANNFPSDYQISPEIPTPPLYNWLFSPYGNNPSLTGGIHPELIIGLSFLLLQILLLAVFSSYVRRITKGMRWANR